MKYALWSIIPVASMLYAFVLFDTWGDEEGWQRALPVTFAMLCTPMAIVFGRSFYIKGKHVYQEVFVTQRHRFVQHGVFKGLYLYMISSAPSEAEAAKLEESEGIAMSDFS
jgi:hypothetical protein